MRVWPAVTSLALSALLFSGCAENAILELDIIAPDGSSGVLHVRLLSTTEATSFEEATTEGLSSDVIEIPLQVADEPPHVRLIAHAEEIEQPLYIGFGICAPDAEQCLPSRVFRVERAFYLGQYTHLDIDLRDAPIIGTEVEAIPLCQVQGCGRSEGNYCYEDPALGARHFCDR